MSTHDERPLLTLLSLATNLERARLIDSLAAEGFDDIALPGARILGALRGGPCSIQALAEATETTKQFAGREVQKLSRARYVSVAPSAEDKRASLVQLAPRGRRLLDASHRTKHALDEAVARKLGERDAASLRRLLERLVATG
jgi:DNA-binding MarR family transcriptional regulator